MRPALLGLTHVLVIGKDVGQRGRDGGVQARVGGHVQRGRGRDENRHVLLPHTPRGGRDPVHHQPAVVVIGRRQLSLLGPALPLGGMRSIHAWGPPLLVGAHLGVPAEGPRGQDLWDVIALGQPARPPRDEPVRKHGPDGRPAEGDVMVLQEPLEPRRDLLPADPTEDALRQAGRLDDLEALQDRRLRGDELQQQHLRLLDVVLPALLPRPVHALVQRVRVPPHPPSGSDASSQALYSDGLSRSMRRRWDE